MSAHSSIVGGSNAGRLLACPGSFQATQALPPTVDTPSEYAEEGSFAHVIMAILMTSRRATPNQDLIWLATSMIGQPHYDRVFTREHYDTMIEPALAALAELGAALWRRALSV